MVYTTIKILYLLHIIIIIIIINIIIITQAAKVEMEAIAIIQNTD